jgi:Fur family zinc uptake transcriptional regulator
MFLSCEQCGHVFETDGEDIFVAIDTAAHEAKFTPRVKFVEVSGTCQACAGRAKD